MTSRTSNGPRQSAKRPSTSSGPRSSNNTSINNGLTSLGSEQSWLGDLKGLLLNAEKWFGDVAWRDDEGDKVFAHKCIVFARSSGTFQQQYIIARSQAQQAESTLSLPSTSHRSLTPSSHRPSSPTSVTSHASTALPPPSTPLQLGSTTDITVFKTYLEHFYTGSETSQSFGVVFEGFEADLREDKELKGIDKLRSDLLYAWRSKLYSDVSLVLGDSASTTFHAHRAILVARSPYFRSLLLGSYSDSTLDSLSLPSPPFTPSATTFVLGYMYTGTLDFGHRQFDLSTAFEIHRCAGYLSLSLLSGEIETRILNSMLNIVRAARVYVFALAPEISSSALASASEKILVEKFGETWGCPQIGNLDYEHQSTLVRRVCEIINPITLIEIARMSFHLRKKLELERASWSEHIKSMLDAIDERIKLVLGRNLGEVVKSEGFVRLVDGHGFGTDVLEWLVSGLVVGGLKEENAVVAYETLVGVVLLREEGIMMDAKVIVEDARNGIIKYIKRRWLGIVNASGFINAQPWAVSEISDAIEVPKEDLLAKPLGSSRMSTRSAMGAGKRIGSTATMSTMMTSHPSPRRSTLSSATHTTTLATSRSNTSPSTRATSNGGAQRGTSMVPATNGNPRTQKASITSLAPPVRAVRNGIASTSASTSTASPSTTSSGNDALASPPKPIRAPPSVPVAGPATSMAKSSSLQKPDANGGSAIGTRSPSRTAGVDQKSSVVRTPRPSTSSISSVADRKMTKPAAPSTASAASRLRSTSTSNVTAGGASTAPIRKPTANASTPPNGRVRQPTTSTASRRPSSVASTASTSMLASAVAPSPSGTIKARPITSRARAPSLPRTPKVTTSTPVAAGFGMGASSTPRSVKGKERATENDHGGERRRTASGASARSVSSVRAVSVTSTPPARKASATSLKAVTPKASMRSLGKSASPAKSPPSRVPLATKGSIPPLPKQSNGVPGTTLLSGIPCIVTVPTGADAKSSRFRAAVRYIGAVHWEAGQWIGLEVNEGAIPEEAQHLAWNDGQVEGKKYFEIKKGHGSPNASETASSGRVTPYSHSQGDALDGRSTGSGSTTSASLRPPSRRGRRSSSSDNGDSGPKKGLFVRPNQIVYVL